MSIWAASRCATSVGEHGPGLAQQHHAGRRRRRPWPGCAARSAWAYGDPEAAATPRHSCWPARRPRGAGRRGPGRWSALARQGTSAGSASASVSLSRAPAVVKCSTERSSSPSTAASSPRAWWARAPGGPGGRAAGRGHRRRRWPAPTSPRARRQSTSAAVTSAAGDRVGGGDVDAPAGRSARPDPRGSVRPWTLTSAAGQGLGQVSLVGNLGRAMRRSLGRSRRARTGTPESVRNRPGWTSQVRPRNASSRTSRGRVRVPRRAWPRSAPRGRGRPRARSAASSSPRRAPRHPAGPPGRLADVPAVDGDLERGRR